MKRYQVLSHLIYQGKIRLPGEIVEMLPSGAASLVQSGVLQEIVVPSLWDIATQDLSGAKTSEDQPPTEAKKRRSRKP